MANVDTAVQQQLALLKESFGAKLIERIAEIEAAALPLTEENVSQDDASRAVDTLQALSHKLTGSAGTFGFAAISVSARKLEQCSGRLKDATISESDRSEVLQLLADLVAVVEAPDAEENDDTPQSEDDSAADVYKREDFLDVDFLGDDGAGFDELKERLAEFGFNVRRLSGAGVEGEITDGDSVGIIVELDSTEWRDAPTEKLMNITGLSAGSIAIGEDVSFDRRLAVVRMGFDTFIPSPAEVTAIVDALDRQISARQPDPFRVLIVDDDPELAAYVEVVLGGAGMITTSITDPFAAMEAITEFCPELILLDINMPDCSGTELASVIRQQDSLSSVSIVFLSGETDPSRQIAAMHTGGDDFLPKTLRAEQLVSAIEARANRFRQLRSMLVTDSLTGLLNHTATKSQMEVEIARAKRESSEFSFVLIDIDHFKAVNDTYGHGLGDQVIRSLALLLKQRFRTTDVIGRLGGEEFGIVLSGTGRLDAERIVNEVRETFAAMQFQVDENTFSATFSAGVSFYPNLTSVAELSDAADQAMYRAKENGRNMVVLT